MADSYQWDGKEDTSVITIPDTLSDGTPVTSIGGFIGTGVPISFEIKYAVNWPELPRNSKTMSEEEIEAFYQDYADDHPDDLLGHLVKLDASSDTDTGVTNIDPKSIVYKDITFTINIGKNVSNIGRQMSEYSICYEINNYGIVQPDGVILVYRPSLDFIVDPENKTFYSKDGILFNKADGQPIVTKTDESN